MRWTGARIQTSVTGDTFVNCETAVNRLASPEELSNEGEEEPEVE